MMPPGSDVVVIGGGAAGLTAAFRAAAIHRVTLIEAEPRLGGHAWTWTVPDGPDAGLPLDLGFMVLNDRTYPAMHRLLDGLDDVRVAPTEMSFGFRDDDNGLSYVVNGLPDAAPDARFLELLPHVLRFQRRATRDLDAGVLGAATLGAYLDVLRTPAPVIDDYLLPMGAAIWSTAPAAMRDYPAASFLAFFRNHGLLTLDRPPTWQHLVGGARTYVAALRRQTRALRVIHACALALLRHADGVTVQLSDGTSVTADAGIVATQADQALRLLDAPAEAERNALAAWRYQDNYALLHTDARVMPKRPHWASWNARRRARDGDLLFTYWLNRLQNHDRAHADYFLTLADRRERLPDPAAADVLLETRFRHPVFIAAAIDGLRQLDAPGCAARRTWFCGSYFGHGFHEDAIASGERVAAQVAEAA